MHLIYHFNLWSLLFCALFMPYWRNYNVWVSLQRALSALYLPQWNCLEYLICAYVKNWRLSACLWSAFSNAKYYYFDYLTFLSLHFLLFMPVSSPFEFFSFLLILFRLLLILTPPLKSSIIINVSCMMCAVQGSSRGWDSSNKTIVMHHH